VGSSKAPGAHGGHVVARPHMPMSERAKIFIPFDPLPGYRQLLREREEEVLRRGEYEPPKTWDDGAAEGEDPNHRG